MGAETRGDRIRGWLREHQMKCVCDECIAQATGEAISRRVSGAASRISVQDSEFTRFHGRCDLCGAKRMVNAYQGRSM